MDALMSEWGLRYVDASVAVSGGVCRRVTQSIT